MSRISFPRESSQMAAIQASMPTASLGQLRNVVEELSLLSQKTGGAVQSIFSSNLFEAAMQRADELNDREIALNHQICLMREELGDLAIAKDRLTPQQISEELDVLQQKIFSCIPPSTHYLSRQINDLKRQWMHIHFQFEFPLSEELNPDSFQSNLHSRLTHQIQIHHKDDPEQAAFFKAKLALYQQQCQAAEEIFSGKGLHSYWKLPSDIRKRIDQRLFDIAGSIENVDPTSAAAAVMAVLSEQMDDC